MIFVLVALAATAIVAFGSKPRAATFIQVDGRVSVNGTPAVKGATVLSDSIIKTEAKSSAVVSLGKLGRVEVLPETEMKLSFDGRSISIMLEAGRVRVSTGHGVSATVSNGSVRN
jgi:hypothetical protein